MQKRIQKVTNVISLVKMAENQPNVSNLTFDCFAILEDIFDPFIFLLQYI